MKNLIDWFRYEFIRGIKNLIYWFPIIWKDRDYDHHYIFQVLKHKLKKQAYYLSIKGRHMNVDYDIRNINICIKLIEKVQDEYYIGEYFDYQSVKFNFVPIPNTDCSELKIEQIWENYDKYIAKYPLIHKKILNGEGNNIKLDVENDKQLISMRIGHYNHERAKKLLFKILEDKIESWWD